MERKEWREKLDNAQMQEEFQKPKDVGRLGRGQLSCDEHRERVLVFAYTKKGLTSVPKMANSVLIILLTNPYLHYLIGL